jgi:hypothetical protein
MDEISVLRKAYMKAAQRKHFTVYIIVKLLIILLHLLLQSALQPLGGFRPAQLSLSILSGKVLQSVVASGTSNPQLGGEPGI